MGASLFNDRIAERVPVQESCPADAIAPANPLVCWPILWRSFKDISPVLRFSIIMGGTWLFYLPSLATYALGDYLVQPTTICVHWLFALSGDHISELTGPVATVKLQLGTAQLWISPACTPAASWAIWIAFCFALSLRWRMRAYLLPAGLAVLWALNVIRIVSVLLAQSCGYHHLSDILHDSVWPWMVALTMIFGAWFYLKQSSTRAGETKGGESRCVS
jgi:exosortase/archaeosortase family protein